MPTITMPPGLARMIDDRAEAGDGAAMIAVAIIEAAHVIGREIDRSIGLSNYAPADTGPGPAEMTVMDRRNQHAEFIEALADLADALRSKR